MIPFSFSNRNRGYVFETGRIIDPAEELPVNRNAQPAYPCREKIEQRKGLGKK